LLVLSHTLTVTFAIGIATVSQLVIFIFHLMPFSEHEPLPDEFITSKFNLCVGGGGVHVGVIVGVLVRVAERFMVGVLVGVYIFLKFGKFPDIIRRVNICKHPA